MSPSALSPTPLAVRRSSILDASGDPVRVAGRRRGRLASIARSGIDAADENRHNEAHFADADGRPLSAVLTDDLDATRSRLRYETRNNGNAKGMIDTLANLVVGTGPTLQVHTGEDELDRAIEAEFAYFADDCQFAEDDVSLGDLMTLALKEQCNAGEEFLTFTTDPDHPGPIKLRLVPIAPERVATPWGNVANAKIRDGIEYDARNRRLRYHVSDAHPKDTGAAALAALGSYSTIAAADMRHLLIPIENGQHRGFPWFTPALSEMASTRRFVQAVLSAAETAADLSLIISTTADSLDPQELTGVDSIPIEKNTAMNLPAGWTPTQLKPEQPHIGHAEYMRERLRSMGRPIMLPYNLAAADSKDYNFASGRLDHQTFHLFALTLRHWHARKKLRWILRLWLAEARRSIAALAPLNHMDLRAIIRSSEWHFKTPLVHGNPLHEQKAITEGLSNGSLTYIDVCADQGLDWETQLGKEQKVKLRRLQLAAELKGAAAELGLTPDEAAAATAKKPAAHTNEDRDENDDQNDESDESDETPAGKPAAASAA